MTSKVTASILPMVTVPALEVIRLDDRRVSTVSDLRLVTATQSVCHLNARIASFTVHDGHTKSSKDFTIMPMITGQSIRAEQQPTVGMDH